MPTYQYACTECGHAFDQVQSFSDDALTVCPQCEGRLRKVYNAVGVVFKGSGFYRNDSRASETAAAKGDGASDGSSGADTKTETTPGGKPDGKPGQAGEPGKTGETGETKADPKRDSKTAAKSSAPSASGTSGSTSAA